MPSNNFNRRQIPQSWQHKMADNAEHFNGNNFNLKVIL